MIRLPLGQMLGGEDASSQELQKTELVFLPTCRNSSQLELVSTSLYGHGHNLLSSMAPFPASRNCEESIAELTVLQHQPETEQCMENNSVYHL